MDATSSIHYAAMNVNKPYILFLDCISCLKHDKPGFFSLSDTPCLIYGKVIKPIQCYPRLSRYFMIDFGHIIYLVGAGVMAHEQGTYWVAEYVVKTAGVTENEFEEFKKKEEDNFWVTPMIIYDVPKCIAVYWDRLTDKQRERAKDAISKAAFHKMLYGDGSNSDAMSMLEDGVDALTLKDSSSSNGDIAFDVDILKVDSDVFCPEPQHVVNADELEPAVKALEANVSNLKFKFDVNNVDMSPFSKVCQSMIEDLRHDDNAKNNSGDDDLVHSWY